MKILFITSTRLGDAVLSTGLLRHIREKYPDATVTIACGKLPAPIFSDFPCLERLIVLNKTKYAGHWFYLLKETINTNWDIIIDLRNSFVSRVLPAKEKYIFGKHIDKSKHKVEQNADVMKLDYVPAPIIWLSEASKQKAAELIPDGTPVLGIGPTSNWPAKTWPAGCFIELISELLAGKGNINFARIAIFGAPDEYHMAKPIIDSVPKDMLINLVGKTNPIEGAAALARCALYIGNDSGLMHIAASVGTKTIGLFGPGFPDLYAPWGEHCKYVRTPETAQELTSYKGYHPDTAPCLMNSLEPVEVIKAVNSLSFS